MVDVDPENGGGKTMDFARHTPFPGTAAGLVASTKVGNRLHLVARIRERVRKIEARHDIRPNVRVRALASMWEKAESPQIKAMVIGAMRRVTRQKKRAKYPVFYKVEPLVEKAFDKVDLANLAMGDLVDRLILNFGSQPWPGPGI